MEFIIKIEDTQEVNGITYTQAQLQQGLAQIRTAHNQRTGELLTDAEWLQWADLQNLAAWYEQGKGSEPIEPSPVILVADWAALQNLILGGALYDIYIRLTAASFAAPDSTLAQIINANNIAVASGKLDQAVTVTKNESAVYASFQLLIGTSDYRFTNDEKTLWNSLTDSLNFSNLVHLP
jgi:hypothetical protein